MQLFGATDYKSETPEQNIVNQIEHILIGKGH